VRCWVVGRLGGAAGGQGGGAFGWRGWRGEGGGGGGVGGGGRGGGGGGIGAALGGGVVRGGGVVGWVCSGGVGGLGGGGGLGAFVWGGGFVGGLISQTSVFPCPVFLTRRSPPLVFLDSVEGIVPALFSSRASQSLRGCVFLSASRHLEMSRVKDADRTPRSQRAPLVSISCRRTRLSFSGAG